MGKKTKSSEFVSCVSCFYCSKVSFESNDSAAYAAHLRAAHNIVKNVEALLRLTKQLQGDEEQGKAQEQESVPDPVQIQTEIQAVQQVQADQQVKAVLAITKPKVDVDNGELFQEVGKSKKKNKRRTSQPVIDTKEVEKNDTEESLKESKAKSPEREMKEKETPAQVHAKKNEKPSNLEMKENVTADNEKDSAVKKEKKKKEKSPKKETKDNVLEVKEKENPKKKESKKKEIKEIEKTIPEIEHLPKKETKKKENKPEREEEKDENNPKNISPEPENKGAEKIAELTKAKQGKAKNNKKKGKNEKPGIPQGGVSDIACGAVSGIVEKEAMKEVDNILDQWFKGGREEVDDDDDIPDDLPDIDDAPEIKPKPQSKSKLVLNPNTESKPKAETKPKMATKAKEEPEPILIPETKIKTAKNLGSKKVESRIEELPDDVEVLPEISKPNQTSNTDRTDLDEVNDILDEWFASEGLDEDENDEKITEITEPEPEPVVEEEIIEKDQVPCGDCVVCGRLAKAACSGCKHVFYCTREHQKKDWTSHKDSCKEFFKLPYRVERSKKLGRFLAATKDLAEGELILQESPMVIGPRQLTKPVCLGCHKEIASSSEMIKCIRCNWPVCSLKCQDSPQHDPECRATKAAGSKVNVEVFNQTNMMYACITVIRALALQDGPKKVWEDYVKFDSHLDERIKTPIYNKVNKEKVVFFMHHYLGIKRYSDLEILEASGKLDTNCFEIRQNGQNLRAMYRTACIISHDCTPNTRHTFSPDNSINIYTTRKIEKGSIISATYTNTLWPTLQRREHLNMSKCFWCSCRRCRDPTELGSYLSAIRCSRCLGFRDNVQNNDLQYITPTNPLNPESLWKCSKCTNIQKASQIKSGNASVSNELSQVNKGSCEALLKFLHAQEPVLGPNNHHVVEVKYTIVSILGNRKPYMLSDLSMELLQIKERFCRELLNIADLIEPGYSRWRGQLLLELQMAIVALAAGQAEAGMISKSKAKEKAEEGLQTLTLASSILQVEPEMKETLMDRIQSVSDLLASWEE
ncbi:uncharacterized protein LOC111700149 isoform X2 [Eurytemora carolleeae]|uniref:uncharacterized protein LOC111700149 isoform X2 n=1 Tax=Eurytemora carolleeae TaxID=1294199 RepID=UPI000C793D4C|nr:uncharacterized protein LOC111700149 isoform X2 [Eurytemora carolleeae]|eukprot:XP_023326741.1 uncharacterized protein LOC111700149 isoform X2 [Eurytemora affinis]